MSDKAKRPVLGPANGNNGRYWYFPEDGTAIYSFGHPVTCRFQAIPPDGWEGEYDMRAVCDSPEDAALWLAEQGLGPWAGLPELPPSAPHDVAACSNCRPRTTGKQIPEGDPSPLLAAYRCKTLSPEAAEQLVAMLNDPNRQTHKGEEVPAGDLDALLARHKEDEDEVQERWDGIYAGLAARGFGPLNGQEHSRGGCHTPDRKHYVLITDGMVVYSSGRDPYSPREGEVAKWWHSDEFDFADLDEVMNAGEEI